MGQLKITAGPAPRSMRNRPARPPSPSNRPDTIGSFVSKSNGLQATRTRRDGEQFHAGHRALDRRDAPAQGVVADDSLHRRPNGSARNARSISTTGSPRSVSGPTESVRTRANRSGRHAVRADERRLSQNRQIAPPSRGDDRHRGPRIEDEPAARSVDLRLDEDVARGRALRANRGSDPVGEREVVRERKVRRRKPDRGGLADGGCDPLVLRMRGSVERLPHPRGDPRKVDHPRSARSVRSRSWFRPRKPPVGAVLRARGECALPDGRRGRGRGSKIRSWRRPTSTTAESSSQVPVRIAEVSRATSRSFPSSGRGIPVQSVACPSEDPAQNTSGRAASIRRSSRPSAAATATARPVPPRCLTRASTRVALPGSGALHLETLAQRCETGEPVVDGHACKCYCDISPVKPSAEPADDASLTPRDGARERDDVDEAGAAVDGGQHLLGRVAAAQIFDHLGARAIRRQIHAAEERVLPPRTGEFPGAFFRHEKVPPQRGRDLGLRRALSPGQIRRLVLGVVLQVREPESDLQILVGDLLDFGQAHRHEHGVVADPLGERSPARVHGEDRGLEPDAAPDVEPLHEGGRRDVARNDLVARRAARTRAR